jgi:hypothetical protein
VQLFKPDRVYPLDAFRNMPTLRSESGSDPIPDPEKSRSYYNRAFELGTLPLSVRYWLTVSAEDLKVLGKIDRSKVLWGLYKQLHEAGFTPEEIFQMTYYSAINKFVDHPGRLWAEIGKATLA